MNLTAVGVSPSLGVTQYLEEEAGLQLIGLLNHINPILVAEGEDPITVTEGGRTYARQKYYRDGYLKKLAGVPGYEHFNLAADPDSPLARHVPFMAADLAQGQFALSDRAHELLVQHCQAYGWEWTGRNFGERWHFERRGPRVNVVPRKTKLIIDFTPTPSPNPEEKMVIVAHVKQATASWKAGDKFVLEIGKIARVSKDTLTAARLSDRVVEMNKSQFRKKLGEFQITEAQVRATQPKR